MPADVKPTLAAARRLPEDPAPVRSFALRAVNDMEAPIAAPSSAAGTAVTSVSLTAAIVSIQHDAPMVLTITEGGSDALPSALFRTPGHASLDACLRDGVAAQTGLAIDYADQLLAFADEQAGLGIGYLALSRATTATPAGTTWRSWYEFIPWEDWRGGRPAILAAEVEPRLRAWAAEASADGSGTSGLSRSDRIRVAFGLDRAPWNEERVAERFELIVESGLASSPGLTARSMRLDHLRVLANGIGALRVKLKTRPVVFELMEPEFTLFELQKTVEAVLGPHLHKQNFRRLVESAGLVEPTGDVRAKTGGRPAKLFRFRQEVVMERAAAGVRVHAQRTS